MNLLETESFEETFGKKHKRKRPKLPASADTVEDLVKLADGGIEAYSVDGDSNITREAVPGGMRDPMFEKGTSKRIWGELYKVIDSSDVIIQVLDARDPMGTRSFYLERQLKKDHPHKHLVFILNKCDLIPTWATVNLFRSLSLVR